MTNDFERDVLRCWGKMRRSRKASSWGLRVRGQTLEISKWKLHQSRSWTGASSHLSPSKWRCSPWPSAPAFVQKALTTAGALQIVVVFTPLPEVLPAELAWSQGSCRAVTELCSWNLSGPAPVHTRHERRDGTAHSSWHVTCPGRTSFSSSSLLQPNQRCLS